jgi:hypothetical protein
MSNRVVVRPRGNVLNGNGGTGTLSSFLQVGTVMALAAIFAALVAYGTVIASNTSRTRAAVKRIPRSDVLGDAAISTGNRPGWEVVHKFGLNPAISAPEETIWFGGGLYTFLASAERLSVVSGSASDAAPGGTGARTIRISGIDGAGAELEEEVTMNGVTPVLTTGSFFRVNRVRVTSAGSTENNVGSITLTSVDTATLQASIQAATGSTQLGFFSLPSDKQGFVTSITMSAEAAAGTGRQHIRAFVRDPDAGTEILIGDWGLRGGGTTSFTQEIDVPILLQPSNTIEFRATSTSAGAIISVFFIVLTQEV